MRLILFTAGFVSVPALVALVFRKFKIKPILLSYLISIAAMTFYYLIFDIVRHYLYYPLSTTDGCGHSTLYDDEVPITFFVMGLLFQAMFNAVFTNTFKKTVLRQG